MKIVVILFIDANQSERKSKQILISEAMTCWKTNIKRSLKDIEDKKEKAMYGVVLIWIMDIWI